MFHREGQKIILLTFFLVVVAAVLADFYILTDWIRITVQMLSILILVSILQFFRNPKRISNKNFNEIHAPVDGKVVVIERVMETEYFKEERLQISIFMSPVNVHVTRYPASGVIKYSKYHPGKYLVAWHPKSSEENERTTVVIRTPKFGDILYRQIAGAMARRIVNYAEEGESVQQGEESGFIKFGSRVDVFLPLDALVAVKLNQKVKGAITCLASLNTYDGEG
ncbi:phosphatidylserine decarboxylase family protein [Muriicola sp.]|uniref:phosphatidylserine decarboxylase family protein n=3 Tax=Muriicola sp. TaxID=2020856 RepID=UPI003561474D